MRPKVYTPIEKEAMKKINQLISNNQIQIIMVIKNSTYKRCQIKDISKEIGISYMAVKRNINILCEIKTVRKSMESSKRLCYYEFTEFGKYFSENLEEKRE